MLMLDGMKTRRRAVAVLNAQFDLTMLSLLACQFSWGPSLLIRSWVDGAEVWSGRAGLNFF